MEAVSDQHIVVGDIVHNHTQTVHTALHNLERYINQHENSSRHKLMIQNLIHTVQLRSIHITILFMYIHKQLNAVNLKC